MFQICANFDSDYKDFVNQKVKKWTIQKFHRM